MAPHYFPISSYFLLCEPLPKNTVEGRLRGGYIKSVVCFKMRIRFGVMGCNFLPPSIADAVAGDIFQSKGWKLMCLLVFLGGRKHHGRIQWNIDAPFRKIFLWRRWGRVFHIWSKLQRCASCSNALHFVSSQGWILENYFTPILVVRSP